MDPSAQWSALLALQSAALGLPPEVALLEFMEKPFACDQCPKRFRTPERALAHRRTDHLARRGFQCQLCAQVHCSLARLERHLWAAHGTPRAPPPGPRTPRCELCSKEFSTAFNLKRHRASHCAERPFKCPECPYASKTKHKLKTHAIVHSKRTTLACDICGAKYLRKASVARHKRTKHAVQY